MSSMNRLAALSAEGVATKAPRLAQPDAQAPELGDGKQGIAGVALEDRQAESAALRGPSQPQNQSGESGRGGEGRNQG